MIPRRRLQLLFFLGLTFAVLCAGCASKPPTVELETVAEPPPAEQLPQYPGAVYEAGDEIYPDGYYIHTVTLPDESISIIAKWFTGDLLNWELLAKCNPEINPNRIFLGDKIRVPRILMTRQDPMTAEFVIESQPKPKRKKTARPSPEKPAPDKTDTIAPAAESPAQPVEETEPVLFGPKG
jgi:hypothetical protein